MNCSEEYRLNELLKSIELLQSEISSISDRACAIVCSAYLDDLLESIIFSFLTNASATQNRQLTSQNGPLSTFSSKIVLAYRLGLISKKEFDDLNLVRKIRNLFAHDLNSNSFDCECIKSLLSDNIPNEGMLPPTTIPISFSKNNEPFTPTPEEFVRIVSDEKEYSSVVSNFPQLNFVELDKNDSRSIFTSIVYILQAELISRQFVASLNKREESKKFNSIVDLEEYKINSFQEPIENQLEQLNILKLNTEQEITKLDNLDSPSEMFKEKEEIREKLCSHYAKIQQMIDKITSAPLSLEKALIIHSFRLLNFQNKSKA